MKISVDILNSENQQFICKKIEEILEENKQSFQNKLIGNLSFIHHQAQCHNGIDRMVVSHSEGNNYQLEYEYDWHVYNGCSDMEENGTECNITMFKINQFGDILLDIPHDQASTFDEL